MKNFYWLAGGGILDINNEIDFSGDWQEILTGMIERKSGRLRSDMLRWIILFSHATCSMIFHRLRSEEQVGITG